MPQNYLIMYHLPLFLFSPYLNEMLASSDGYIQKCRNWLGSFRTYGGKLTQDFQETKDIWEE